MWQGFGGASSRYLVWSQQWFANDGFHVQLFRWSSEHGITAIGEFQEQLFGVTISSDGNVLVASRDLDNSGGFRWSPSQGLTPIDFSPFALNGDGSVIVGARADGVVRWTEETGSRVIQPGVSRSLLSGLVATASLDVVAGSDRDGNGFRWTESTGSKQLGAFEESGIVLQNIDSTGDVLAGVEANVARDARAFRWTETGGF